MPHIRTSLLSELPPILRERSVSMASLLAPLDLTEADISAGEKIIPLKHHAQVFERAAESLAMPHLTLVCADRHGDDLFGPWISAFSEQSTSEGRMAVMIQILERQLPQLRVTCTHQSDDETVIRFHLPEFAEGNRQIEEQILYLACKCLRELFGDETLLSVHFRSQEPKELAHYEQHFSSRPRFAAAYTGIRVCAQRLQRSESTELNAWATRFRHRILARHGNDAPRQVEHVVSLMSSNTELSLERVAYVLDVSPRTLQRRLRRSNTQFQGLVDRVLCAIACEYLRCDHRVGDIAKVLGFTEISSFSRFFKRVKGIAPSEWAKTEVVA